ncbi:MAG: ABC transporter ATP-binding protein, partial [Ardenticatenaceae bacterium]
SAFCSPPLVLGEGLGGGGRLRDVRLFPVGVKSVRSQTGCPLGKIEILRYAQDDSRENPMNYISIRKQLSGFALDMTFSFGQETVVLFGPSGAGKSLTLQAIAGLLRPNAGRIELNGVTLFDSEMGLNLPPQARRIGYVMQQYALFPHLSVVENIAFGLYGLPRAEQDARISQMLKLLRLEGLVRHKPRQLSGGQQQRVALARALVTRPHLLLLDEPFAALDTPMRARLRRELLALQRRVPVPTLLVTHDLAEAHMLADRMAVVDNGKLLQIGPPSEVLRRPATRNVARFTGARNIFVGSIESKDAQGYRIITRRASLYAPLPQEETTDYPPGTLVECCVRPELITFVRPGQEARRAGRRETLLQATIVEELNHGVSYTLFLHIDHTHTPPTHIDLEIELSHRAYRLLGIADRRQWTLAIKQQDVHLIGPATQPYFEGPAPQPG